MGNTHCLYVEVGNDGMCGELKHLQMLFLQKCLLREYYIQNKIFIDKIQDFYISMKDIFNR